MLVLCLTAGAFLSGCGYSSGGSSVCSAGTLTTSHSASANFALVPAASEFTVYPGGSVTVPVYIQPVGNSQGTVMLSGASLPQGLSVVPVSAPIGSTANLTLTATDDVVTNCFTGKAGVYTAAAALTLSGSSGAGNATSQIALNVVLENPAFTPTSTNLPVMTITTADAVPVASEDDYVDATLAITDAANKKYNYSGTMGIKGHGHSTWLMPKKPYRLNLDSKASLLGMTSDSNWILLANYDDKSMLRNDVSFEMSTLFGMFWTPSSAFVEVYLNGAYQGVYELTEKVEVSKARLNIGSIDDTDNDGANLTGGYLAEIDHYDADDDYTLTSFLQLPIGLDDPSSPTTTQQTYFSQNFYAAEASMYGSNSTDPALGWRSHWDEASLVNWFLIEELAGNVDADDWSSDYFYKPRSDPKFYRGPVWDMDVTFGNTNYAAIASPSIPWVSQQAVWYLQLMKDPVFVAAVKARWKVMRAQMLTMPAYIDQRAASLTLAAQNDHNRWTTFGEKVFPNPQAAGSYQGETDLLKSWLTQRIAYMDSQYLQ